MLKFLCDLLQCIFFYYSWQSVRVHMFFFETKANIEQASYQKVEELQTNDGHSHVWGIDELFSRGNRDPSSCAETSLETTVKYAPSDRI